MSQENLFTKMMSLKSDISVSADRQIAINKFSNRINRKAREQAKDSACCICGKDCTSFCKSHSVPHFTLLNIAENGKVAQVLQGEIPTMKGDTGLGSAGTFHLICRACDSSIFQAYENPDAYSETPTERMLAQIAAKNELHMISKRKQEIELYDLLEQRFDNWQSPGTGKSVEELDLIEYRTSLQYALKTLSGQKNDRYHLCFFRLLDYVVPLATQSSICMVADLEGEMINNIYNFSEQYHMASIHVAVFPLNKTSVVLLFVESNTKRYRKFIRQLNKLDAEDQLAAINYMIFSYTENTFLNPTVYAKVKKDDKFMEVCRRTGIAQTAVGFYNPIEVAVDEFSFSKRSTIPNLLSKEYALKDD